MQDIKKETLTSLIKSTERIVKPSDTSIWTISSDLKYCGWWENKADDTTSAISLHIRIGPHTLANLLPYTAITEEFGLVLTGGISEDDQDILFLSSFAGVNDGVEFHFDTGAMLTMLHGELANKYFQQTDPGLLYMRSIVVADDRVISCPCGPIAVNIFGEWLQVPCCFMLPNQEHVSWWYRFFHFFHGRNPKHVNENRHLLGMRGLLSLHLFCISSMGVDVFRRKGMKATWSWDNLYFGE